MCLSYVFMDMHASMRLWSSEDNFLEPVDYFFPDSLFHKIGSFVLYLFIPHRIVALTPTIVIFYTTRRNKTDWAPGFCMGEIRTSRLAGACHGPKRLIWWWKEVGTPYRSQCSHLCQMRLFQGLSRSPWPLGDPWVGSCSPSGGRLQLSITRR